MNELRNKAKDLLTNGEVDLFIGYGAGTRVPRPYFVSSAEETDTLIFDEQCTGNLAVYLTRKDLTKGKKVGIAASYYALKSIAQLFAENQLNKDILRIVGLSADGALIEFNGVESIEQYLKETPPPLKQTDDELIEKINALSLDERWEFWTAELSKCFKCYACRAACPMCYCSKCIVEVNRPQWIQPWASTLSNMEWQINRVMHIAGRCSDCGSCGIACPLGIPVHLLAHQMAGAVKANFNEPTENGNVLSMFKPDDKENFIL